MTFAEAKTIHETIIKNVRDPRHPARRLCSTAMTTIYKTGLRSIDHLPFTYEMAFRDALRAADRTSEALRSA